MVVGRVEGIHKNKIQNYESQNIYRRMAQPVGSPLSHPCSTDGQSRITGYIGGMGGVGRRRGGGSNNESANRRRNMSNSAACQSTKGILET